MRKLTLTLALVFSLGAVNSFAVDKTTDKEKKEKKEKEMMKMAPGKSCTKKCADKEAKEEKKTDDKKA